MIIAAIQSLPHKTDNLTEAYVRLKHQREAFKPVIRLCCLLCRLLPLCQGGLITRPVSLLKFRPVIIDLDCLLLYIFISFSYYLDNYSFTAHNTRI